MTIMGKFVNKKNKDFKPITKRGRLIVRNLPFKCKENDIMKHFSKFGEIKDINLLRRPDKKLVGCGFVEFVSRQNADKAKAELNGQPFLGRQIYIETAKSQNVYDGTTKDEEEGSDSAGNMDFDESLVKEEPLSSDDDSVQDNGMPKVKEEVDSENKGERENFQHRGKGHFLKKGDDRQKSNIKKARLIVRNLSFKTTEETLKQHFSQFGEVVEVLLLRKPDKSLVGCGFVQFNKKLHAAKAIHHTSGKPFLGRPIVVDWAIAKDKFRKFQEESIKKEVKEEDESKDEYLDEESKDKKAEIKVEDESSSDSESESEESDDSGEEDDGEDDSDASEAEEEEEAAVDTRKLRNDDVDEGKTVFVKNLPFSVTDQEFRERVEEFGPVFYALVCKDKLTEHSKGTGFVKFKNKEDAEKCLSAGTEFSLKGNILDPHPALKRSEAQQRTDKAKEMKDKRNLYLMKEGMIIAGTPAAKGVSVPDMERRLQLEQWKSTKLRNLNMFVSPTRLVIHNLPPNMSDKTLRKLFLKHAGPKAVISECRVMRDFKQSDSTGKSVSKGYGFIGFRNHEDALRALRSINNNPAIFTPTARPIVAFSVENKTVLNAKKRKLERSRQKNPLCKDYKPEEGEGQAPAKKAKFVRSAETETEQEPEFAGLSAKPGAAVKMRQKYKLKNQVQQHVQDVRKHKREVKMSRKARRQEHIKNKQVEKKESKKTKKVEKDTAFSSMVNMYKSKMLSQSIGKKKWYDE